jgi:tetratricopeptide (TPR) repeat protein
MPLPPQETARRTEALAAARADLERDPAREDAIIWVGRRQAYLGLYREAIDTFTRGLSLHPRSFKLLRHRGHRWITTRRFDRAVQDLARAAELIRGVPDEVEPDGAPNALNQPTSTAQTNIFYHLGLARFLRGEDDAALAAWRDCLERCRNDDMSVATRYWLYLTLRRLGREAEAAGVLEPVTAGMTIIENTAYHRLLLLFKGELAPHDIGPAGDDAIQSTTEAYGLASWHGWRGDHRAQRAALEAIVRGDAWPAFGHIAAEAELARLRGRQ